MKKFLIFLFIISSFSFSQDYIKRLNKYDRINNYDVIHYKLNIEIDINKKFLWGKSYITFTPIQTTDSISIDAENMKINGITLNNDSIKFIQKDKNINVFFKNKLSLKDTVTLCIDYELNPGNSRGIKYFLPENNTTNKIYQCWTQGEEELNHFWFPCYDFPNDRITSEIIATVGDSLEVISNGKLLNITYDKQNRKKTYHWLQDKQHVTYLVSLVVGNYVKINDNYKNIPTPYYVYEGLENNARNIFKQTKDMINFYEKITGVKYPWDKYSQTILRDFFGGMENTSATNLIDDVPDEKQFKYEEKYTRFYTTLIAHELAHMWYGDLITCKNWAHLWLNEGFAEFLPGIYYEKKYGKEASQQYYLDELNNYLTINSKEKMPTAEKGSNNIYPKGALILKMLRDELGDNLFWKAIKDYTKNFNNSLVITDDLQKSLEKSTGKDLSLFFKQWVYYAGHPKFKIIYNYDSTSKKLSVKINQVQKIDSLTGIFTVNPELEIITKKGTIVKKLNISKKEELFEFENISKPLAINFDPYDKIIKETEIEETTEMLINKLLLSKSISAKIYAASKLKDISDSLQILNQLIKVEGKEKAINLKLELLKSIANSKRKEALTYLIKRTTDNDPRVRRLLLFLMAKNYGDKKEVKPIILKALNDSSYSVIASAIQNLVIVDSTNSFDNIIKCLERNSYRNTIQEHALGALVKLKDERAIPYFKHYFINASSQLAKNSAFLGLVGLAKTHPELYDIFIEQLKSDNSYFRRMSANALAEIGNKNALIHLQELKKNEKSIYVLRAVEDAIKKLEGK
ncbi:MAG TPA: M1 family aminopeptidase [Bacteroidota bacterium]|jgi:aminopeptidase N|nr:M1 family aminopeptidase [Bacteroidota bacterium]